MRKHHTGTLVAGIVTLCMGVSLCGAAITGTYVDADGGVGGNTVNATNASPTDWFNTSTSTSDGYWRDRPDATGEGGDFFETIASKENVPLVKTTLTDLLPLERYAIRIVYTWDEDGADVA